ncbi:unnamed protein product, partial [Candidula unifasciata]
VVELNTTLTSEHASVTSKTSLLEEVAIEVRDLLGDEDVTAEQVAEQIEAILLSRIKAGDKAANFQLGLLYFHQNQFKKALRCFEHAKDYDYQSLFMYGVMKYDGLGTEVNMKEGMECMFAICASESRLASHLISAAQYNLGRAYYQGFGEYQSDKEAEKWFLLAADDGNPAASVKAQSVLGMFYSRQDSDFKDLKKAFFWHSEACGNGSLESQGALGVIYGLGLGVKKDMDAAHLCLKEAANRGNVYAMGNLVMLYYKCKLFTKACSLGYKVSILREEDVPLLAAKTDCLPYYMIKGIAIACFVYARCLASGLSIKANKDLAKEFYSKCYRFDEDVCAILQHAVQQGSL